MPTPRLLGEGDPLLLVHGSFGAAASLGALAETLAPQYRAITYDRRGFGDSRQAALRTNDAWPVHADDAAMLLRQLAERGDIARTPAWILGCSSGGLVALALARRHPSLVRGLILVETPHHAWRHGELSLLGEWLRAQLLARAGLPRAAATTLLRAIGRDATNGSTFDALPPATREELLARAPSILAELLHAGTGEDTPTAQLSALACPAAVLVGERARLTFTRAGEALAYALLATPMRMPGASHFAPIERPFVVAATVRQAIARLRTPRDVRTQRGASGLLARVARR